jgi:hypothetical protein
MKRLLFALVATALLSPAAADAQLVHIRVDLPELPPLVVVSPGIQVVENHNEEIFFHDGWYWVRRSDHWYRARHPRHEFVHVEHRVVPRAIFGLPPGHYRHYRHQVRAEHQIHAEEARLHEREMRQREEERRHREREMRQREEERRHREREEAERRREDHREMRHEDRGGVHRVVPVRAQPESHQGQRQGEHDHGRH